MDYNVLRKLVAGCVEGKVDDINFRMNMFKLRKKVEPLGLIPVVFKDTFESKRVTVDDIPYLMEHFKDNKIQWFDSNKSYITLIFIRSEDMDDELQEALQDLLYARKNKKMKLPHNMKYVKGEKVSSGVHKEIAEIPAKDMVATLAKIVGNYPAYTAVVAKWVKPDSISLNIRFRANSIMLSEAENESSTDNTDSDTESGSSDEDSTSGAED